MVIFRKKKKQWGRESRAADGVREPSCLMRSHLWHWV